jgi:hypothetical protein
MRHSGARGRTKGGTRGDAWQGPWACALGRVSCARVHEVVGGTAAQPGAPVAWAVQRRGHGGGVGFSPVRRVRGGGTVVRTGNGERVGLTTVLWRCWHPPWVSSQRILCPRDVWLVLSLTACLFVPWRGGMVLNAASRQRGELCAVHAGPDNGGGTRPAGGAARVRPARCVQEPEGGALRAQQRPWPNAPPWPGWQHRAHFGVLSLLTAVVC